MMVRHGQRVARTTPSPPNHHRLPTQHEQMHDHMSSYPNPTVILEITTISAQSLLDPPRIVMQFISNAQECKAAQDGDLGERGFIKYIIHTNSCFHFYLLRHCSQHNIQNLPAARRLVRLMVRFLLRAVAKESGTG